MELLLIDKYIGLNGITTFHGDYKHACPMSMNVGPPAAGADNATIIMIVASELPDPSVTLIAPAAPWTVLPLATVWVGLVELPTSSLLVPHAVKLKSGISTIGRAHV